MFRNKHKMANIEVRISKRHMKTQKGSFPIGISQICISIFTATILCAARSFLSTQHLPFAYSNF